MGVSSVKNERILVEGRSTLASKVDLDIRYPRVAVIGNSGEGKTYLYDTLRSTKNSGITDKYHVLDRCILRSFLTSTAQDIERDIVNNKDKIIIIDCFESDASGVAEMSKNQGTNT